MRLWLRYYASCVDIFKFHSTHFHLLYEKKTVLLITLTMALSQVSVFKCMHHTGTLKQKHTNGNQQLLMLLLTLCFSTAICQNVSCEKAYCEIMFVCDKIVFIITLWCKCNSCLDYVQFFDWMKYNIYVRCRSCKWVIGAEGRCIMCWILTHEFWVQVQTATSS